MLRLLLLCILLMPALSGCAGYLIRDGMNGIDHCPPTTFRKMGYTRMQFNYLNTGQSGGDVMSLLGQPDKVYIIGTRSSDTYDVWYYQTMHKSCNLGGHYPEYTPVTLYNNRVIGIGVDYYQNNIYAQAISKVKKY